MARGKAQDKGAELNTSEGTKLVRDIKGELINVPADVDPKALGGRFLEWNIPQQDEDGTVPEFVNMSGKTQKPWPYYGTKSIRVPPWGILKGSQWRHTFAQTPDGSPAKFEERKADVVKRTEDNPKGYDPEYLLTEEQAIFHAKHWRGGGANGLRDAIKTDKEYTIKRLQGLIDNGKFVAGDPNKRERDLRPKVYQFVNDMKQYVQHRLRLQELDSGVEMNENEREAIQAELTRMRGELFGEAK